MQTSSWLPMASLGQTITTHQGKQLGVTKISWPCDCLPMFGLLRPNLTHFVHTNEENWGHALQFCRAPPSISYRPCAADMLSPVWAEPRLGCNELENRGNHGEHSVRRRDKWASRCRNLFLKIQWMCLNQSSLVKSCDCCNLRTMLV